MELLLTFTSVTIFTLMLTIGVNNTLQQLTALWRQPELLLRSLLAVIVLVPLLVALLLWVFELPPAVATALAILAAAPGAPLTTKRSQMAAGDVTYTSGLQLTLGFLAVAVTPLSLAAFYALFDLTAGRVVPLVVVRQVAVVTFLPVTVGLLLGYFAPKLVAVVRKPLNVLANVLFVLLFVAVIAVLALAPDFRMTLRVGWPALLAIVIMALGALTIGHLLGGPARDRRSALAIASVARNVGLALFIAGLGEAGQSLMPTIWSICSPEQLQRCPTRSGPSGSWRLWRAAILRRGESLPVRLFARG